MHKITLTTILAIAFACQPGTRTSEIPSDQQEAPKDPNQIYNFMGEELPKKELRPEALKKLEKNLVSAFFEFQSYPDSLELRIWYGRRLAYLGKYLEAIQVYSDGIVLFPESHQLRRHRGHRHITSRQIEKAVIDLEEAANLSENSANQIEPDGIPNKLNQPLSNDKFNIWYHLGLAYYLNGRFDKALSSYIQCQEYSDNEDLKTATTYWQYLTYHKLGNSELANELISKFDTDINLVENDTYLDLLRLFKNELDPESLTKQATTENGHLIPTLAYGIGAYYQHQGKFDKANELFLRVLDSPHWDAFGYIASEAELTTIFPVP